MTRFVQKALVAALAAAFAVGGVTAAEPAKPAAAAAKPAVKLDKNKISTMVGTPDSTQASAMLRVPMTLVSTPSFGFDSTIGTCFSAAA